MGDTERTRTVSWEDPAPGAEAAREMSGLEYLRAMMRGELPGPPIAGLLGFGFVEVEVGRVVFECEPAEYHYNPIGSVHGHTALATMPPARATASASTNPPERSGPNCPRNASSVIGRSR